jgi:hypothetical protein
MVTTMGLRDKSLSCIYQMHTNSRASGSKRVSCSTRPLRIGPQALWDQVQTRQRTVVRDTWPDR